ncbi:MAG TPA: hypothetical protein VGO00_15865 [Kofleriaceae bacterium]|jgi:hypothetical protein|nr:hypothetical protein [Kofleriaceae bacterium]
MAEARWLIAVRAAAFARLAADPDSIDALSTKAGFTTYVPLALAYFAPAAARALEGVVERPCSTVVGGVLGLVPPPRVGSVLARLDKLDLERVKRVVAAAKPKLVTKVADDFQLVLGGEASPDAAIAGELEQLRAFYRRVARLGRGVAMYTS